MEERTQRLFEHELRDIYDAEHKLVQVLERQARDATDPALADGFRRHRQQTRGQIGRLEEIFRLIERSPRRERCAGIDGLIEEYSKFKREESPDEETLDVFLASAARKVEFYEIAAYSSLIDLAQALGLREAVSLLDENRAEEVETAAELEGNAKKLGAQLSGQPEGVLRQVATVVGEGVKQGALLAVGAADVVRSRASDLFESAGDVMTESERRGQKILSDDGRTTTRRSSGSRSKSKKGTRKSTSSRSTGSRSTAKRATGSRTTSGRKASARKTSARKTTARKASSRPATKKSGGRAGGRKTTARKTTARKTTSTRKAPAGRTTARKTSARKTSSKKRPATTARRTASRSR